MRTIDIIDIQDDTQLTCIIASLENYGFTVEVDDYTTITTDATDAILDHTITSMGLTFAEVQYTTDYDDIDLEYWNY